MDNYNILYILNLFFTGPISCSIRVSSQVRCSLCQRSGGCLGKRRNGDILFQLYYIIDFCLLLNIYFLNICRQYHYLLLIELLKTIVMKCKLWVICNRVMNMLFWSIYGCDFRFIMVEMVNKYSMRLLLLADWRADNVMSFSLTALTMRFCIWIYLNTYKGK